MADIKIGDVTEPDKSNRWLGRFLLVVILLTPILILIFSNTVSATLHFAGFEWKAPLWLVLAATFLVGAVVTRLFGAAWRHYRKHRRQLREGDGAGHN
jgi:uncharacterized integral membrane protein